MQKGEYEDILRAYLTLKKNKSEHTRSSGGCHYNLALSLMVAGIRIKGLDNDQLEGVAETIICKGYSDKNN